MLTPVLFVNQTELLQNVNVKMVMLKLMEFVMNVPILVNFALDIQITVSLVLKEELMLLIVSVLMDYMIPCKKKLYVKNVISNVKLVKSKKITV
jgi:hypothetical protein